MLLPNKQSTTFWSKVDIRGEDECWPWLGQTDKDGYGQFCTTVEGNAKTLIASRVSFQLTNNVVLDSSVHVRHSCDNRPCCNPKHLLSGSHQDNMKDKRERGRNVGLAGDLNAKRVKALPKIALAVAHVGRGYSIRQAAAMCGIHRNTLNREMKKGNESAANS